MYCRVERVFGQRPTIAPSQRPRVALLFAAMTRDLQTGNRAEAIRLQGELRELGLNLVLPRTRSGREGTHD